MHVKIKMLMYSEILNVNSLQNVKMLVNVVTSHYKTPVSMEAW